jgi:hypothetical protein
MLSGDGPNGRTAKDGAPSTPATRMLPDIADPTRNAGLNGAQEVPAAPGVRVKDVMQDWRMAIVHKDAEVVERVDRLFAEQPREFIPALMISAESDPEERVRSFSTRVLGKLRPPESAELMRKLLSDRSAYVRFNAAWALGELSDHDAVGRLRDLQRRDPAASVRESASASLRKLGGG